MLLCHTLKTSSNRQNSTKRNKMAVHFLWPFPRFSKTHSRPAASGNSCTALGESLYVAWYGCYDHHSYSCFLSSSILWLPCLSSSFWFDFATKFTSHTMVNILAFATKVAHATVVTKFVWLLWIPFLPRSPSIPKFLRLQW